MRLAAALPLLWAAPPCAVAFAAAPPARPHYTALATPALRSGGAFGRWRRGSAAAAARPLRRPRAAAAEGAAAEEAAEAADEAPFEADFRRAAFGASVLTVAEAGVALRNSSGLSLGIIPVLLLAVVSLQVLQSAAGRKRLNGGTFRMLSLASLAAFSAVLYNASFDVVRILLAMAKLGAGWAPVLAIIIGTVAIRTALPAISASYGTLAAEGLPKFKTAIRAEKGNKDLLTLLAVGYVATALHQLIWGGAMLLYSPLKTVGALRCFMVAACAHVCQTAAVAGPKRLSSETYRKLNLALMLDSAVCFATVAFLGAASSSSFMAVAAVGALPLVALLSSGGGWAVGKLYRPE